MEMIFSLYSLGIGEAISSHESAHDSRGPEGAPPTVLLSLEKHLVWTREGIPLELPTKTGQSDKKLFGPESL